MMLGLSLSAFTTLHVIISLVAIAAGLVVFYGWLIGWESMNLTHVFLATTVLTTVTGFMFPFIQLLPSHITGFVSVAVLVPALYALYGKHAVGGWRKVYLITALIALYLQLLRAGGADVSQNSDPARAGAERKRAALPGGADRGARAVHLVRLSRGEAQPARDGVRVMKHQMSSVRERGRPVGP